MFFLARFVHRDLQSWRTHLRAHMDWLADRAVTGDIAASGPVDDGTDVLGVIILLRAPDQEAAMTVLAGDPIVQHDVTEDLVMVGWNPFIGTFADETEPPARLAELISE